MPKKWATDAPEMFNDAHKAFNRVARAADAEVEAILKKDRALRAARKAEGQRDA